jgi:hypothetical protein
MSWKMWERITDIESNPNDEAEVIEEYTALE